MNFTIVGAGALGTILGAHLIKCGHEVNMIARRSRADQLKNQGLHLSGLVDHQVPCTVIDEPTSVSETDVLIFAVKTYQMNSAIESVSHIQTERTFSVANGVMKNQQLATAYGEANTLGCMADTSGELRTDGTVEFTRNICLHIGSREHTRDEAAEQIASQIDQSGVRARCVDRITVVEWSKYVGWTALFTLALLARAPTGRLLSDENLAAVAVEQIKEMGLIASKKGIELIDQSPLPVATLLDQNKRSAIETIQKIGAALTETVPNHRMSTLQDLEAGRKLEVRETLGHARTLAAEFGLETPVTEMAYRLALGIDALQSAS